jgi:hypothetical protein
MAAMLDDRSEQQVTTLDKDLASHPTWLPGDIIASDLLNFFKIFFSDTTGAWN